MADTDSLVVFFLFLIVVLLGVVIFIQLKDKILYNDNYKKLPTKDSVDRVYVIEEPVRPIRYINYVPAPRRTGCLSSYFSCILSCPRSNKDSDLYQRSCVNRCEDDLFLVCGSKRSIFEQEDLFDIRRFSCLEDCREDGSFDRDCTRDCIF